MTQFHVAVRVTPRKGLLDPQGKAVNSALHALDFPEVDEVRIGRLIRVTVNADSAADARARVDAMCQKLLANPVTEDYAITFDDSEHGSMGA